MNLQQTLKQAALKSKTFRDYQQMLTFTINLCYKGKDYVVGKTFDGWIVRYQ